jgi:exopolysaccharide biosynthesis polyprenyl glycosylphosphotransferase
MIRRHGFWFRALLISTDAVLAVGLLVALSAWRFGPDWAVWWREIVPQPVAFLALYATTWVSVLALNGLYRPRARWTIRSEAVSVVKATAVMALITLSVLFLFRLPDVSRLLLLGLFPAQAVLTILYRAAMRMALERYRRRGHNTRFVLVLGAGARAQAFAAKLESHRELGLRVVGFLDSEPASATSTRWPLLGSLEDLESILHGQVIDEVAICLPFSQWDRIDAITGLCEEEGKIVRIPMDVLDRAISVGKVEELDGTPVFSLVSGPDRTVAFAAKRLVDVVASAIGLVVLSPVLLVVALAIFVDAGRPVLFRQDRIGLHGRPFRVVKFRSMSRDAEARLEELEPRNEIKGRAFKVTDDPRVTRVGRFLRRSSLDELPQLINVLRGEMSLVGPRPPLPGEVDGYDLWHRRRLSMKPGITGLWQVRARREPEFDRWVAADLEYIDRWSLWLDVKILARTIPAAFEGR